MSRNRLSIRIPLPGAYKGRHGALCREASVINNSCQPNAIVEWIPDSFSFSCRAVLPISKGDEIFRAYIHPLTPRDRRRQALKASWDFECQCPSCALPDAESAKSDEARQLIQDDFDHIFNSPYSQMELQAWLTDSRSPERRMPDDYFVETSERMLQLMDQEQCEEPEHRACHYFRLILSAAAVGDLKRMRKWAQPLLDIRHMDEKYVKFGQTALSDPEALDVWGIRTWN
ncbi:SET domain-containing protein [Mycena indigotica]|uniref:SET domain-containing protein n=1 Tax=Mycena indigotica TaxID=2126181 RepID=A0A8H6S222_9AGAR|nr:SET domain-containing protein [Mycena indigotica]KAF7290606.1 SET domain-containing protein [Mycena indigotica]